MSYYDYSEYLEDYFETLDTQTLIDISQFMFNKGLNRGKYVNVSIDSIKEIFHTRDDDDVLTIIKKVYLAIDKNTISDSYTTIDNCDSIYISGSDFEFCDKSLMAEDIAGNLEICSDTDIKNINAWFNLDIKLREEIEKEDDF